MTASLAPARAASNTLPILGPERPEDGRLVAGLIERAFGPGRYAKAAERLRERNAPLLDISFVAWSGVRLVGCVRMWPIHVGGTPAVFLGPFAVEPEFRSLGLGATLIRRACAAAGEAGHRLVLLVGDGAYFEPLGFTRVPPGRLVLPGPVDPARVLTLALQPGADRDLRGAVVAG
ncbi:MAG: N-acetyltransferase [Caulobacteraceae bacterium]|nr:N-acetyltransferase [Caulobacteraceae bacterium]